MKKKLIIFSLSILIIWALLALSPKPKAVENNGFLRGDDLPLIIAHGGGNLEYPDNTLEAYYHAYSINQNVMLETDISLTKDGVLILSHDTTLDRKTTLQNAPIIEINYQDLVDDEIDFGYENLVEPSSNGFNLSGDLVAYTNYLGNPVTPLDITYPEGISPRHPEKFLVTTLEELIKSFPTSKINVEIKQSGEVGLSALAALLELMDSLDEEYNTYERLVLATFHESIYDAMVEYKETTHPNLLYSPQNRVVQKYYILQRLKLSVFFTDSIAVLQVPVSFGSFDLATKSFIETAQKHNIAVHYWTINDEETMRMLIELGVDGIMTDRVTLLNEVLNSYE